MVNVCPQIMLLKQMVGIQEAVKALKIKIQWQPTNVMSLFWQVYLIRYLSDSLFLHSFLL